MSEVVEPDEALRAATSVWWMLLLAGLLSLIAGVVVLVEPAHSLRTLTVVAGVFVLVDSVVELAHVIYARAGVGATLFGAFGAVIGLLLIRYPIHSVVAVALMIGIWLVAIGMLRLSAALVGRREAWLIVTALIEIVAGAVIVASPGIGVTTLALLVGISFILNGAGLIMFGWALRTLRSAL